MQFHRSILKTEWLHRLAIIQMEFSFPFMGGSGPLPFYVSFLFMALMWVGGLVSIILFFSKSNFKKEIVMGIFILGLVYNGVFIESIFMAGSMEVQSHSSKMRLRLSLHIKIFRKLRSTTIMVGTIF